MTKPSSNYLLIELLTEELPPINLENNIGNFFAEQIHNRLEAFLDNSVQINVIATPRRFGVLVTGLNFSAPNLQIRKKGPAISSGLNDGHPTNALYGFAKSCGVVWQDLEQNSDGYFYFNSTVMGKSLDQVIEEVIQNALKAIPINKPMRWANYEYYFVRPVHNLLVMFNDKVLDCEIFGLKSGNYTFGHRFMAPQKLFIEHASNYFEKLEVSGKVIAKFDQRRQIIVDELAIYAAEHNYLTDYSVDLLDEVTALVEYPVVLFGMFPAEFLEIPPECLTLSMAKNQKYFALFDKDGKLTNCFLFVANLLSSNPDVIIHGNQKVLVARLADAQFFYELDKKTPLKAFGEKLANVVYHNKLGSQMDRVLRIEYIAKHFAADLGVDHYQAANTARLLKVDLVSEMVGEFPELQGIMGKYYARLSGEDDVVAVAIEQHYYPRFSGDRLPESKLGILMSLADKFESIVGIWSIGIIPSGDKDPYGLRRAALGIVRLALSYDIDIKRVLQISSEAFGDKISKPEILEQIYSFIMQRLANYLVSVESYSTKHVNAVLAAPSINFEEVGAKKLNHLPELLNILANFAENSKNHTLLNANKRIENILKKNDQVTINYQVLPELLIEPAEKKLYDLFYGTYAAGQSFVDFKNTQAWPEYFDALAEFNQPVDDFFATVMVMSDEAQLRNNRVSLLHNLHQYFNLTCKLSELI